MKTATLILAFTLFTCCNGGKNADKYRFAGDTSGDNTEVMICTSGRSYAYHKRKCEGLEKCNARIKVMTVAEAKKHGRKPCKY
jgi:hypothetical protein